MQTQPDSPSALAVPEFCRAHRISRAHFYELLKRGLGPRVMKVGARTLVSQEAASEWRERMTNEQPAVRG